MHEWWASTKVQKLLWINFNTAIPSLTHKQNNHTFAAMAISNTHQNDSSVTQLISVCQSHTHSTVDQFITCWPEKHVECE